MTRSVDRRYDVSNSAVVIIDVQNDFCHAQGLQGRLGKDLSRVDATVGNIISLTSRARDLSIPVVYAYTTHSPELDSQEWLSRRPGSAAGANCVKGTWGAELFRLEPDPADIVVEKHRYSAFVRTELEEALASINRRSLFFCGYTSSACVESSLRDAVCRDFLATLVTDCCDCYTEDAHRRAVEAVSADFGVAMPSDEVFGAWQGSTRPPA